jgi:hypothetical protein
MSAAAKEHGPMVGPCNLCPYCNGTHELIYGACCERDVDDAMGGRRTTYVHVERSDG